MTWQSVKGADGYALNIIEFNGKVSRELINSSISGENISDTTYTLDNKIFKHNKIYSWNVHAKRGDERSGFSERFYFKIIKVSVAPQDEYSFSNAPVLVFPKNNFFLDKHQNPTDILFIWKSIPNVEGYALHLSKRKKNNEYDTLFNSVTEGLIRDTTYFLRNISIYPREDYRWTVRAYGPAGWSEYSVFNTIKNQGSDFPITPHSISPGNSSYEEPSYTNLPVVMKWKSFYDAVEYAVYVSEKLNDGNYKLIYNSQQEITVTDTTLSLPNEIFKEGSSYKWNVRIANSDGWNGYSSSKYFRIVPIKKSVKPDPISPGALTERSRSSINTLTPNFVWSSVEESSFYNIIISRKSFDGSYKEIYNNDTLLTNEFQMPEKVLQEEKIISGV